MRLRHRDGTTVHLAYCTNVHPAEDVDGVVAQLRRFAAPVRARVGGDHLGVGLWLARDAAATLAGDPGSLTRLREEIRRLGLEVVTLNGFPYQAFHAASVKKAVYRPDWSEPERLSYTLDLAGVLAQLLPDDVGHGSISTVPLGWRAPWHDNRQAAALAQLGALAEGLDRVAALTGRRIRVGLEPEPGCVVETTQQAVDRLAGVTPDGVGVCVDACHLAVGFEDPGAALACLGRGGLPVVKLQASAGLHVDEPNDPAARAALARFAEERFLHQVRERAGERLAARDDLGDALGGARPLGGRGPWRVHFHVPVHAELEPPLRSTRAELDATLRACLGGSRPLTDHVEVETYTWDALPDGTAPTGDDGLVAGIAAEITWVRDRLLAHGLKEAA